jgi:hypothetical protein
VPETTDPRQRGFAAFSPRPQPADSGEPAGTAAPPRRGIAGPPPPKPAPAPPRAVPDDDKTSDSTPQEEGRSPTPSEPAPTRARRTSDARQTAPLGSPRHNLRYVQFQCSPVVSDLFTQRAEREDVVLGEIAMDAVRTFARQPQTTDGRRRRRSATAVRRSVLLRPEEADEVREAARRAKLPSSALIRTALERYLS